ncbi:LuxR C-terminal-related transcriptional regulator [Pseudomonas sp. FME51]|uniref:LuxR C-terminal-related transcriptional regulator n=1 Tax=Pseudomonas sp. FME51 TaxID=2742609 RepID=UPI0018690851|nr:LuxR C-terminal-related transcriptional regulator [Pseudomonas sp. FME51]
MSSVPFSLTSAPHNLKQVFLPSSKLQPPAECSHLVRRDQLCKRLKHASNVALAILQSPPGYGRSTLMGQHYRQLRQDGQRVGWLALNEDDRALTTFSAGLKGVIELADQAGPMVDTYTRVGETELKQALTALLALLQVNSERPLYLFIDDVHHLSGTDSVRLLSMLIEHAPQGLHFILSFLGDPCLSVARHRMHGQVFDLTLKDLRFTHGEMSALLASHGISSLDGEPLAEFEARMDGWVGGLRLAALLLQRNPAQLDNLVRLTGERRQFAEFFMQDVLLRQPVKVQEFLLHTAILERFSIPLCQTIMPDNDNRELLRECEQRGLFLLPLDDEGKWYRYHPLFAEFLRQQLQERQPELFRQLSRRASDWFCDNEYYSDAFSHALVAGESLRAVELMDAYCEEIFSVDGDAGRLVDLLPPEQTIRFPRILLALSWNMLVLWQFEIAGQLITQAATRIEVLEAEGQISETELRNLKNLLLHRQMMMAMFTDNARNVEQMADQLIEDYEDAHPLVRASLYTALIYARRESLKLDDIEYLNKLANEHLSRSGSPMAHVFHQAIVGPARYMTGRTHLAVQSLTEALRIAERIAGKGSPQAAVVAMHLARIHFERDELSLSRQLLDEYLPKAASKGFVDQTVAGWLTQAKLSMIDADAVTAFKMLDQAELFAETYHLERLRLFTLAERLKWLLRQGEINEVIRLGRKYDLRGAIASVAPHQGVSSRDEARALCWIRVAFAEDRLVDALNQAKQWRHFLSATNAVRSVLRWDLIIAHLALLSGDQRAAQRTLRRAMFKAAPTGFIRVFLDEGAWLETLLREQLRSANLLGEQADVFASELLKRFGGDQPVATMSASPSNDTTPVAGALTSREIEILKMVDAGLLNREIGGKLGMTEGSVKWYLQQVYDKIGIRRRSLAADRARQLGMLQ